MCGAHFNFTKDCTQGGSDMEKMKTEVKICGKEYTIVSAESPEYMHKVASYIDKKMTDILSSNPNLSSSMAAVLTAINIGDDYFKAMESAENMRAQVGKYIDDQTRQKMSNAVLKEEAHELRKQIMRLQMEIAELKRHGN